MFPNVPIVALTVTATEKTKDIIILNSLGMVDPVIKFGRTKNEIRRIRLHYFCTILYHCSELKQKEHILHCC